MLCLLATASLAHNRQLSLYGRASSCLPNSHGYILLSYRLSIAQQQQHLLLMAHLVFIPRIWYHYQIGIVLLHKMRKANSTWVVALDLVYDSVPALIVKKSMWIPVPCIRLYSYTINPIVLIFASYSALGPFSLMSMLMEACLAFPIDGAIWF